MKKKMLLIDGQILQTEARDRGMGRYSASLIKSLLDQKRYSNVKIIINNRPLSKSSRFDVSKSMFGDVEIIPLDLKCTLKTKIESASRHNKNVLNKFISGIPADAYEIDYLIPSLFQEPAVSVFPDNVKKVLVFYDLIPYLHYRRYQALMQFNNYLKRFRILFEADSILTISHSVRDDLMVYLGIPGDRITAIDGAAFESDSLPERPITISVPGNFILMPTSDDPRKNNIKAVLGFEKFRSSQGIDHKLVITSKIHKSERFRLESLSKNLLFTGNIDEAEMDWLYRECQAVLFVPESEGLGLPILEAVLTNKRVVCSSINVFKEISEDAFFYCNHEDPDSIAHAIKDALLNDNRSVPKTKYKSILDHYSWPQTATRAISAIKSVNTRVSSVRPKIAIFIPTPDGLSAIGKVVAEAHPALSEYFDIDYFAESGQKIEPTRPNYLQYVANYLPAESFSVEMYSQYEAVFYHIGNSDYHTESIRNCLYLPGIAILHDTNISEAYRIMNEKGMISNDRRDLEDLITDAGLSSMSRCISSVVNNQLGVMTHSEYAAKASKEVLLGDSVVIPAQLATYCPSITRKRDYSKLTVGLAGIIADIKGIAVIEKLANNPKFHNCDFRLFGYNYSSKSTIDRLQTYNNVSVSTDLSDFDFQNSISNLDVFVNYRMKYQGETSLSTIEAMRQGVVVIVRNVGWYSELPDDAVVKVESEEDVVRKIVELMSNPSKLAKVSANAKEYINKSHSYVKYVETMTRVMKDSDDLDNRPRRIAAILKQGKIKTASQLLLAYQQENLRKERYRETMD